MLTFKQEAAYHGPNPYCRAPVLVVHLRISPELEPKVLPMCQRFRGLFPQWLDGPLDMECSPAVALGRMATRWALSVLNEVRGFLHEAGAVETAEGARCWLGFHHQGVSRSALELAFRALLMIDDGGQGYSGAQLEARLEAIWTMCRRHHPDYQARILMQAAYHQNLPALRLVSGARFWQFGWGQRGRLFFESSSSEDGFVGAKIAESKATSKSVFFALGAPTPRHELVYLASDLDRVSQSLGWPCVTKPLDLGGGSGVTANIRNVMELRAGFEQVRRYSRGPVMVEAFVPGDDHRLMVVRGKLVAAIRREASSVVGDGRASIGELVSELNRRRSRNMVKSRYLRPIALDEMVTQHLARQGFAIHDAPPAGRRLTLRSNANLSTGGVCTDVTASIHQQIRSMAESLALTLKLECTGLDYITTDISRPWSEVPGAFIEINVTPGLDAMVAAGWDPVEIGAQVLGPAPGRIPLTLAVVDDGQIPEMQRWLDNGTGAPGLAWVCGKVACTGGLKFHAAVGRDGAWSLVQTVLCQRSVTSILLICSVQELTRLGAPVDQASRVWICSDGAALAPDWRTVLETVATEIVFLDSLDGLQHLCLPLFGADEPTAEFRHIAVDD